MEGYAGEPYLRVGPDGASENLSSPAAYLDRSASRAGDVPEGGDGDDLPRWRRLSGGSTLRWHDHRAHWTGGTPGVVADAPDDTHVVVPELVVPVRVGGSEVGVRGDLVWVPGPSPWPWYVLAGRAGHSDVAVLDQPGERQPRPGASRGSG